ncbi:RICIN domain-containing protein [Streptomyces sp. B1866]|uniref:RICIN domain-containing protein n=1 Tax=Streptomyces sp. B1866 TaxID=3075431 RepID=UPI00288E79B8|nr:RICIN domain-containing protein [Streptomyces sp. B1866]MDT3395132.1 RICIN domain-containing protein [Streptomyces sp. B1866]
MSTQSPSSLNLVVSQNPADVLHQNLQVNVPATGTIPRIDVYFLTDSTGSMGPVIESVKAGASEILSRLVQEAVGVGADIRFGVGNYRDIVEPTDRWFAHQVSLTSDTLAVQSGMNAWDVGGGGDTAEGQFYALDQLAQPPSGSIGWRENAKRIIVWFGDAPGHDPIRSGVTGLPYDITEVSVAQKLQNEQIFVLVISTNGVGLNSDPGPLSHIGGNPGQGERMASATLGTYAEGIRPDEIVAKIIELGTAEVAQLSNIRLVPDTKIAPFVRVHPPGGLGPFSSGTANTVDFTLEFPQLTNATSSVPTATTMPITTNGAIHVQIDGVTTGTIPVAISTPDLSGTYTIQSTLSSLHLQLEDPSWTGDGANIVQNDYSGAAAEQWELVPVPGGGYRIRNADAARERYLEVVGGSTANAAEILTRANPSGSHKEWLPVPAGASDTDGIVFKLKNRNSGKVIDVVNRSTAPAARVNQYSYWGDWTSYSQDHNQHWYLQRV